MRNAILVSVERANQRWIHAARIDAGRIRSSLRVRSRSERCCGRGAEEQRGTMMELGVGAASTGLTQWWELDVEGGERGAFGGFRRACKDFFEAHARRVHFEVFFM